MGDVQAVAGRVDGLRYVGGYLADGEQEALLATIDGQPWREDLRRRVQHYGYRYDYTRKRVDADLFLGPLPEWAAALGRRLHDDGYAPAVPDQMIVNEYQPGQGIAAHVDCVPCFGGTVLSVSLGSACVLTMTLPARDGQEARREDVLLEVGSLFVLSGAARYDWRHGIAARKGDRWDGVVVPRGRRVSLTFRTVLID
ncbi:alpha-ketoglutarate-dependent dioxygenase AlkB [Dactylosporangium sp. NPDC051541]|uniref:alpha-ketoglutarate-dependent dioxygenase AlkB n=1 Tax=Dactylosporangium sp. NPDC051541 TaxID=3363977 RepID=UPI0037B9AA9F